MPTEEHRALNILGCWHNTQSEYSQQQVICLQLGLCQRMGIQSVALAPNQIAKSVYQVLAPCPRDSYKIAIASLLTRYLHPHPHPHCFSLYHTPKSYIFRLNLHPIT